MQPSPVEPWCETGSGKAGILAAPLVILLVFASTLVGIDRLGFRDVSHFYTPLYDYVASRTAQQWLPLWNPLDQTGMPLLGETTTAVLYPVRYALFSLPISTETAISWYVVLHLLLASMSATLAARWTGIGPSAARVAGVVYPLSGSILFLYTNPTFLVGAAWLPLVLGAMLAPIPLAASKRILIAGTSMSMMILGGDPQTALHAMIVVAVVWAARWILRQRADNVPIRVLVAAPLLAAALAAPQLAASISWSSQSDRLRQRESQPWLDPPLVGGKRYEAYQYSLAPWHAIELATPNAMGSLLPINRRISRLIPGDDRTWTPSIYMGAIVMLALLCRIVEWRSIDAWMGIALVSLWLAMGGFGVVWLIQATTGFLPDVDSAVGGPYWWLYEFLPGYDSFRYPAKWLTLFSFASAIVTARWIEKPASRKTITRVAGVFAAILALGLITILVLRWNPALAADRAGSLPRDEFWGPLDRDAALSQISFSLVHSLVALAAMAAVFRFGKSREQIQRLLAAVVAIELGIFGYGLIARVPRQVEHELISGLTEPDGDSAARWMRTQTGGGWPKAWKETQDESRLVDVEASLRAAWFGRWHLADGTAVLNNMVSIQSHEMAQFWIATRKATAGMSARERDQFWASIRRWLSIEGVVHTTERGIKVRVDERTAVMVDRKRVGLGTSPTLRSHPAWDKGESIDAGADRFARRLRQIAESNDMARPLIQPDNTTFIVSNAISDEATITTISIAAEEAVYRVQLKAPALLTRPVYQDGNWVAEYARGDEDHWTSARVRRVDHLTQGVVLPMGDLKLRFRYEPWWLGRSLAVAAITWILVVAYASSLRIPRRGKT